MAEIIKGHEFKGAVRSRHDWDSWLDGQQWKLKRGEDFDGKAIYLVSQARTQAMKRGMNLHCEVHEEEGFVILQAEQMNEEEMEETNKKLMERKAKEKAKRDAKKQAAKQEEAEQEEQPQEPKKGRKGRK